MLPQCTIIVYLDTGTCFLGFAKPDYHICYIYITYHIFNIYQMIHYFTFRALLAKNLYTSCMELMFVRKFG